MAQKVRNPTSVHEVAGSMSWLARWFEYLVEHKLLNRLQMKLRFHVAVAVA